MGAKFVVKNQVFLDCLFKAQVIKGSLFLISSSGPVSKKKCVFFYFS